MSEQDTTYEDAQKYARIVGEQYAAAWRLYDYDYDMADSEDQQQYLADCDELGIVPDGYADAADAMHDDDAVRDMAQQWVDEDPLSVTVVARMSIGAWAGMRSGADLDPDSIDILLATGGPAYGVDGGDAGGRLWFQDWFTPRIYPPVPEQWAIDRLAEYWWTYASEF